MHPSFRGLILKERMHMVMQANMGFLHVFFSSVFLLSSSLCSFRLNPAKCPVQQPFRQVTCQVSASMFSTLKDPLISTSIILPCFPFISPVPFSLSPASFFLAGIIGAQVRVIKSHQQDGAKRRQTIKMKHLFKLVLSQDLYSVSQSGQFQEVQEIL